jgi:hypothetical protein
VATADACSVAIAAARVAIGTRKERFFIAKFPYRSCGFRGVSLTHINDVNMESTSGLLLVHNPTDDTFFSKGYIAKNNSTMTTPYSSSITGLDGM